LLCLYHSFSRLPVHVSRSRSCRRCALCPASPSCIHASLHLTKLSPIVSPLTVLSFVLLRDVSKKYIIYRLGPLNFLPCSFFCHLGGVILICGVRICKVVAISIVQYTWVGLWNTCMMIDLGRVCVRDHEGVSRDPRPCVPH
jgi:hypothetical protein